MPRINIAAKLAALDATNSAAKPSAAKAAPKPPQGSQSAAKAAPKLAEVNKATTGTRTITAAEFAKPILTMTRPEFRKLTEADKSRFIREGGRLAD